MMKISSKEKSHTRAAQRAPQDPSRRRMLKAGVGVAAASVAGAATTAVHADNDAPFAASIQSNAAASVALPSLATIALNRLAWGPKQGDAYTSLDAFNALGADDPTRLNAYVTQQLDPTFLSQPDDSDARIGAAGAALPSLGLTIPQLWQNYRQAMNADRNRPPRDVRVATLIRAVFSRKQLYEVMVDFWHNHFSIFAWDGDYAGPTWASYDRDVIRLQALGNFRTMLEAVSKSTAMLYYLDNYISQGALFNENWARELMELHTLGAENYLGPKDPTTIPADPASPIGLAVGYVDNDVYEAARCFTGWRINNGQSNAPGNDGTYFYYQQWHDRANKLVMKQYLPADGAQESDGKTVLDFLAQHPGTARFIVRKLWRRLIGDNAPEPSVANVTFDAAVAKWIELWNPATPGSNRQIAEVVRILALSSEFQTTWGQKIKRPHEVLYSAIRAIPSDIILIGAAPEAKVNTSGLSSVWGAFDAMGQQHFGRRPPDGYPDVRDAWTNSTSMLYRWRTVNSLMENSFFNTNTTSAEYNTGVRVDNNTLIATMGGANTPNTIVDFWIARILGRVMDDAAHRAELVTLMRGWDTGNSSTSVKPIYAADAVMTTNDISNRLRRMIAVILMSPEFQWK